ncbi:50S ribosome-binding GTPase [candidate division WOR-3 bacterium]|nr:50S ribosome-binding GTPase [candidate division WOR-3 bacterium]
MPANLSADYLKAEERYRAATTNEEKLACLEEMFTTIPKHKGTEKMQADIKTRISKLKKEMSGHSKGGAKRADWFHVEKQGAGQVVVFGAPNCGKSALVRELTGLHTEVAAYPFTTTHPGAGMMEFEDIQIQLVDTPPVAPESPAWLFHIMRTADILLWMLDLSDDNLLETAEQTASLLSKANITLAGTKDKGQGTNETPAGTPTPDSPLPTPPSSIANRQSPIANAKKLLRLGAKSDDPQANDRLAILRELIGDVEVLQISVEHHTGLEELRRRLFAMLEIIRVYTKKPGKPVEMVDPVILPIGATVMDAAYHLHKDFAQHLQFARLWSGAGYDGLRVERHHVLQDKDILEFHV